MPFICTKKERLKIFPGNVYHVKYLTLLTRLSAGKYERVHSVLLIRRVKSVAIVENRVAQKAAEERPAIPDVPNLQENTVPLF